MNEVQRLGLELARLKRQVAALGGPQLANSSLEDASVNEYDIDGQLSSVIGKQYDGTHGVVTVAGPIPPTPTGISAETVAAGVLVRWDGSWEAAPVAPGSNLAPTPEVVPLDFTLAEVHADSDPALTGILFSTKRGEILSARGGEVFVPAGPDVPVYVRVVARTSAGKASVASVVVGPVLGGGVDLTNSTVPQAPTLTPPFEAAVYQASGSGAQRAQIKLQWAEPLNSDGSAIVDGAYYEIAYRSVSEVAMPATHGEMSAYTHDELNTHAAPILRAAGGWQYAQVAFDETSFMLQELTPGAQYEFIIRAVDNGIPANASPWSAPVTVQAPLDTKPPETPAPPVVAGNKLSLMVVHELGRADGGTYNLDLDLNHLEVHAVYEPLFEPISLPPDQGGTMLGKLMASVGLITGKIPAIGNFPIRNTGAVYVKVVAVDNAGNKSRPSIPVQATAELLDSAYISELTATKISAGTVSATVNVAGTFRTGGGAGTRRSYMTGVDGFYSYNEKDELIFWTGGNSYTFIKGKFVTGGAAEKRIEIDPVSQTMRFYPVAGNNQNVMLQALYVDQPEDVGDTPGLDISAFNEFSKRAGAGLFMTEDGLTLGMRSDLGSAGDGQWTGYHAINSAGVHRFRGAFGKSDAAGGLGALFVNRWAINAGFGVATVNYGATMATQMVVVATVWAADPPERWSITGQTDSSFTVSYTGAAAIQINYVAMRIEN